MKDTLDIVKEAEAFRDEKGDLKTAIDILEAHLKTLQEDPLILSFDIPLVLKKLGSYYRDIGDTDKARRLYNEALGLARNDLNKIEEADILSSLAFLELKTGTVEKALEYANKSLKYIGTKRGEKFGEAKANAYAVVGNIYFEKGDYIDALENYKRALSTAENIKYVKRVLTVLGDIANVHIRNGELWKAVRILKESIVRAKKFYVLAVPQFYLRLGRIYLEKKDFKLAKENFLIALDCAAENSLVRDIGECNEALGDFFSVNNEEESNEYYKKALESYNKSNYKNQARFVSKKLQS